MDMDRTILLVDDDAMNIAILEEVLSDRFDLLVAHDGQEAVEMAQRHHPWLVLMDIMMPRMNGYEACRKIKAMTDPVPQVILVSAKASTSERIKGYQSGADDYLTKPFDDDELMAKISVHLRLCEALFDLAEARQQLAMDNCQLSEKVDQQNKEIIDSRDLIVFALANLADSRDPETGEHLQRIRSYCKILATYLSQHGPYTDQIDESFITRIYQASPLHDIGKVGIPDVILLKPGRLTDREFDLMKQHSIIGATALENVAQHGEAGGFLHMAIEIARSHHERWDGSGYPDKISGSQIPLSARIAAVADVFDAMTSVRVYKAAFTSEVTRSMMVEESGKHFDPHVIEAFEACFDEICAVRESVVEVPEIPTVAA